MKRKLSDKGNLLLVALAEGPNHGYALAQRVAALTDGATTLGAGTLYATLDRLLAEGLIEDTEETIVDGRARRVYQITGNGRTTVEQWASALRRQASTVDAALGLA